MLYTTSVYNISAVSCRLLTQQNECSATEKLYNNDSRDN